MEQIVESFGKIFSIPAGDAVTRSSDSMTIIETEAQSTFTQFNIESPGEFFYSINKDFYKDLYNEKSPVLGNVNCDGIALINHQGQPYVLLIELKSSLDTDKISEAFQQEIRSFLKLASSLNICNGYDISDFQIRGVIACHPFKTEDAKTKCLHNLLWEKNLGKKDARFKYRMVTEQQITAKFANCAWFIPSDAFSDDIRNHEFKISLVLGDKYEDASCSIKLEEIL